MGAIPALATAGSWLAANAGTIASIGTAAAGLATAGVNVYNAFKGSPSYSYGGSSYSDLGALTDVYTSDKSKEESEAEAKAALAEQQERERVNPLTASELLKGNSSILGSWDEDDVKTSKGALLNI